MITQGTRNTASCFMYALKLKFNFKKKFCVRRWYSERKGSWEVLLFFKKLSQHHSFIVDVARIWACMGSVCTEIWMCLLSMAETLGCTPGCHTPWAFPLSSHTVRDTPIPPRSSLFSSVPDFSFMLPVHFYLTLGSLFTNDSIVRGLLS